MFDSGRSYFLGRSHIRLAPKILRFLDNSFVNNISHTWCEYSRTGHSFLVKCFSSGAQLCHSRESTKVMCICWPRNKFTVVSRHSYTGFNYTHCILINPLPFYIIVHCLKIKGMDSRHCSFVSHYSVEHI